MTNQGITDDVENALPRLPPGLKEKILDAVYNTLCDNRADPEEDDE